MACAPDGTVTLTADTEAWTGDGVIFAMDTANADPWTEEHDLPEVGFDPCGAWDHLERTLLTREYGTTGADTDAYVRDESSFFTCEQHWGTPVMTYAFVAQDAAGNLADCWVVGADPAGLAGGAYASDYNVTPTHDLASCEVGTLAR